MSAISLPVASLVLHCLRRLLPAAVLALAGGCASLPDFAHLRHLGVSASPPQVQGQHGLLPRAQANAILRELERQGKTGLLQRHLAFTQALSDKPLVAGNAVRLLIDGPQTYQAMFDAIDAARDHVNLETYILEEDEVGGKFAALLMRKQQQGVQVNLMYDSVGALNTSRQFFQQLRQAGINICEFNPVNPLKGGLLSLNHRDHRKLLIVDGGIGFTGGINISRVYSSGIFNRSEGGRAAASWRDTHIEVRGPAVRDFQQLFVASWARQSCAPLASRRYFPMLAAEGDTVVQTLGSSPDDPVNLIYLELLSAISHAERNIRITMAYFVPDRQTLDALKEAVGRGVDVTLLLPGFSDYWITFYAGRSHYDELLSAGVKIYERRDALLHAKTAVIDEVWSTVGSSNMDFRSFLHNDEVNVVVLGSDFARQMNRMFRTDLEAAVRIDPAAWRRRGAVDRLREAFARMWEYWL
jgi:cardiolipin synthase